jgi:hypothetical protein
MLAQPRHLPALPGTSSSPYTTIAGNAGGGTSLMITLNVRAEWSLVTMAWNIKRMFVLKAA